MQLSKTFRLFQFYQCLFSAIHDARLRKNLGNVELTIKMIKSSKFMNIFLHDIQVLEKFAESLRQLKGFTCDLPRLLDALLELRNRNVPNDVVKNTLAALLVLFGCDVDENEVCMFLSIILG